MNQLEDDDEEWIPPSVIALWKKQVVEMRWRLFGGAEPKWCQGFPKCFDATTYANQAKRRRKK